MKGEGRIVDSGWRRSALPLATGGTQESGWRIVKEGKFFDEMGKMAHFLQMLLHVLYNLLCI